MQVLESEPHPHSHNQGPSQSSSRSKEGLSLYGLFYRFAKTPQGKHLLRQYFLMPSLNLDIINQRLDAISTLTCPENAEALKGLTKCLKHIQNMRPVMITLRKGISSGSSNARSLKKSVWSALRQFLYQTLRIREIFHDLHCSQSLAIRDKVLKMPLC